MDETQAREYDKFIPWKKRLAREIPFITEKLKGKTVLDLACASGRHSLALEEHGFRSLGVDISEPLISIARELAAEQHSQQQFTVYDIADKLILNHLRKHDFPTYFDSAILLGNAIANLGSYENGKIMMNNVYHLLIPGGIFLLQTINRPLLPHFPPLRDDHRGLVQRIMIPDCREGDHNMILHFNIIDPQTGTYIQQSSDVLTYMYSYDEFSQLAASVGFDILGAYDGYKENYPDTKGGKTVVWVLQKPDIEITEEAISVFAMHQIPEEDIAERVNTMWQDAFSAFPFNCVRYYRFIHPRIKSHHAYTTIAKDLQGKRIMDLGCAMGTDLRQLILDGADAELCYGIDIDARFIKLGKKLYGDQKSPITFLVGNVTGESFEVHPSGELVELQDNMFDLIFSGSLVHMLTESENRQLLSRIARVLANDGTYFGRFVAREEEIEDKSYYVHLFTQEEYRNMLTEFGFEDIEFEYLGGPIHKGERSYEKFIVYSFLARLEK